MTKLRGLAWDHRRCWGPLEASVGRAGRPATPRSRSPGTGAASCFGEAPLEAVLGAYDLVVFDHPFVGEIAEGGLMVPFDEHLSVEEKAFFERDSVGKSWQSYQRQGRQWALPIDAACQVASYRPDLLSGLGGAVPAQPRRGAGAGARGARQDGKWIGLPLVPTDAMCLILTFTDPPAEGEDFVDRAAIERAIGELRELAELVHPLSRSWNPIRCYDHMIAQRRRRLRALRLRLRELRRPAPSAPHARLRRRADGRAPRAPCSAAPASASAPGRQTAMRRSPMRCPSARPSIQRGELCRGRRAARLAAGLARRRASTRPPRNFFADTLKTIQASYLRPTHAGFLAFFRDCAPRAAAAIAGELSAAELAGPRSTAATASRSRAGLHEPHGGLPDGGDRRTAARARRRRPRRVPCAGRREGARHSGVHGRPGDRADPDRDLHRPRPLHPRDLPHPACCSRRRGYLVRTRADRYRLSLKLFELAHMHPPVNRLVECALPVMRELAADTDQSCHLVVLRTACTCWSCCRSIRPCRCAIPWRSARISRSSRRAPAPCCSPPRSPPIASASSTSIVAAGEAGDTRQAIEARLDEAPHARPRDACLAGRRRLHQLVAAGARPYGRGDRRAHRALSAAKGGPLRPKRPCSPRAERAAERISRRARRRRATARQAD